MARKSKVPTPAELARLYDAGHDALTAALDAGCLPADLQNKWPNLLGTLRRVEGQPYHRPGLNGREDPLTDDEKRVLAWEFRKAAQRAEDALKKCIGKRAKNPRSTSKTRHALSFAGYDFTSGPGGTIIKRETLSPMKAGEDYGADPLGDGTFRMHPSGDIVNLDERNRRLALFQRKQNPWAKVFG